MTPDSTAHQITAAELREQAVRELNAIEGGRQTLGRFAAYLETAANVKGDH